MKRFKLRTFYLSVIMFVVLLYLEYSCILQVVKIVPFSRGKFNNNEKIRKKKMKLPAEFVVQYSYIKGTAGR